MNLHGLLSLMHFVMGADSNRDTNDYPQFGLGNGSVELIQNSDNSNVILRIRIFMLTKEQMNHFVKLLQLKKLNNECESLKYMSLGGLGAAERSEAVERILHGGGLGSGWGLVRGSRRDPDAA